MRSEWEDLYEEYWYITRKEARDVFVGLLVGGAGLLFLAYLLSQ